MSETGPGRTLDGGSTTAALPGFVVADDELAALCYRFGPRLGDADWPHALVPAQATCLAERGPAPGETPRLPTGWPVGTSRASRLASDRFSVVGSASQHPKCRAPDPVLPAALSTVGASPAVEVCLLSSHRGGSLSDSREPLQAFFSDGRSRKPGAGARKRNPSWSACSAGASGGSLRLLRHGTRAGSLRVNVALLGGSRLSLRYAAPLGAGSARRISVMRARPLPPGSSRPRCAVWTSATTAFTCPPLLAAFTASHR